MIDSVLTSIKKMLGLTEDFEEFDFDIIVNINSAMFTLKQLGVDFPYGIYTITDSSTSWGDLFDDTKLDLEAIKLYVYMRVRQVFDPPSNSSYADAIQSQIDQYEWRLNFEAELNEGDE